MPPKIETAVDVKRIRRTFEPDTKAWNDDILDTPWDEIEPALSKHTVFAMKNVFFFSHATGVQKSAIPVLAQPGTSAIVEAPTGCGKTLAFLIPMLERIMLQCDNHVAQHKKPFLTRRIIGAVLSPSRVLAEQTFVVAKSLVARFPHNIHVALCDGVTENAAAVWEHVNKSSRGAGTILVSTPDDFKSFLEEHDRHLELLRNSKREEASVSKKLVAGSSTISEELLMEQDEETRKRYLAKLEQKRLALGLTSEQMSSRGAATTDEEVAVVMANDGCSFFLVIDEADVVLKAEEMRSTVEVILHDHLIPRHSVTVEATSQGPSAPKTKKAGQKRDRSSSGALQEVKAKIDIGLFGATVGLSAKVAEFVESCTGKLDTVFKNVLLRKKIDFVSQLSNRFIIFESHHLLHTLVHFLNLHPSKKHFVFFNSSAVLIFVKNLLCELAKGSRPVLFVDHIYAMYEEMKESTKFNEYNGFLQHQPTVLGRPAQEKKALTFAEEKNQHFQSGWKRDGRPPPGTGAILLCTDVAAFGLDVRDVDYVYHFEPPTSLRSYVHRIGRVGRMGMRGSSVLLLPCSAPDVSATRVEKERKATSNRFNTVTNTKSATGGIQTSVVDESSLDEAKALYLEQLCAHQKMEAHRLPPVAPITATIRATISRDPSLLKQAKQAAIALCRRPQPSDECQADEDDNLTAPASALENESWYDPLLAMESLLLD